MNEFEDVLITIQVKNDSKIAESCFIATMTDTKAYALLNEIRGWHTSLGGRCPDNDPAHRRGASLPHGLPPDQRRQS